MPQPDNSTRARDHLANERTFLAWLRTGVAVVVFGFAIGRFAIAIAIGRSMRYFALGVLAVKYGARATAYMLEHGTTASLIIVGVLAAAFGLSLVWRNARARPALSESKGR